MEGALIILAVTVAVGIILYIFDRRKRPAKPEGEEEDGNGNNGAEESSENPANSENSENSEESECCGMHIVCEKDTLSPYTSDIVYYDDEELDRFVGRQADEYSSEEVEEFREVLMTLIPEDLPGWARSITQRRIELPSEIRDELLLLINEQRNALTKRK